MQLDAGVSLTELPTTTMSDAEVAAVLRRTVRLVDPILDVLAEADPLGLKGRSRRLGAADGVLAKAQDAVAWALDAANVPGTRAWDDMAVNARVDWWVHRVGALNTLLVAYPGVLGVVADRLPLQDFLGFTSQAIMLCAVAREHGIDDDERQVRLLAAVLCARDLSPDDPQDGAVDRPPPDAGKGSAAPNPLWRLAGLVRGVAQELAKRPHPRRLYRLLGMLPAVGAIADYFGEYGALVRTAKAGQRWLDRRPSTPS